MHHVLIWALPLYLLAYGALAFALPIIRTWRRVGVSPVSSVAASPAQALVGKLFSQIMAGLGVVAGVYLLWPGAYPCLAPILWLEFPAIAYAGLGISVLSLVWTVFAQTSMGASWRAPATHHQTELVRHGVYRLSRNPIYLGMRGTALGFFLMLPNALTFAIWLLGESLLHIQVRLEEEHLAATHGEAYLEYCRAVRRWL